MPTRSIKIDNADYLFTMDPQRRIIRGGSILIEGSRITRVGTKAELADVTADRVIDARGRIVTPGFVNAHDHLYPQIMRGLFLDELTSTYVEESCAVRNVMSEDEEYIATLASLTEHLKNGTTTVLNPSDSQRHETAFQAYEAAGARVIMGRNVTDTANEIHINVQSTPDALAELKKIIKTYHGRCDGRVSAWVMLAYASSDCSPEFATAAKKIADDYGVGMTFHQSARPRHIQRALRDHNMRPIQYLEKLGVVGPNVVLGHGILLDQAEIDILARTETRVVMCPTTSLRCGYGTTQHGKLPEMLKQGVVVGLGTDSADFGSVDMMRVMCLTAGIYKDARESTAMIHAETALEMATIQGAKAIGLDHEIGSLEVGKKADIVILNTNSLEWQPLINPINSLVYNADGRSVETVIVDGQIKIENGSPTFISEDKLINDLRAAAEQLVARSGHKVPSRWPFV
ncbi:cytosine deaminase-like metal-dependent hydrolase [Pseudomonas sp. GM79]|uniref:amidohydrolase family protein n=1 Tax=Pseudomonas sp. GM79 TaxID=1144338 RepID=UPI00026FCA99|nr:amidohydrolase family protein [Pseudomonas sp. GM79]EJN17876.1 cytosine deaminase-like metal-dependent hydrolase [Pseudomonas sp. GM79]